MKNLFIGIVLGLFFGAGICYFIVPGIKETAYNSGYSIGVKDGVAKGTAEGIAQGVAKVLTEQKHQQDSTALAGQKQVDQQKATHKYKKPEPVQNWRVEGGRIAEPIK